VARLILDTGVLIAAVRGRLDLTAMADEDDIALPAVAVAEYQAGVLGDEVPARQAQQRAFLDEVLQVVPVLDYDAHVAEQHAALLAATRQAGLKRGAHDLLIAATARASDRVLVTTDAKAGFDDLPDVHARLLTP
jgi:tRNA(fMet)-specific endonuclease VapC